jgi:hypothetical protein
MVSSILYRPLPCEREMHRVGTSTLILLGYWTDWDETELDTREN